MSKHVQTTSEEGFVSTSTLDATEVTIDPTGQEAPDTLEYLLATYAACFVPALRVGAEQRDVGDLGNLQMSVTGDLNDSDKLQAIAFDVTVDADISAESAEAVISRAVSLCKVHDALKPSLGAQVTLNGHTV